MRMRVVFFVVMLIVSFSAVAEETDFFHEREFQDSSAFLDQKMSDALRDIAGSSKDCAPEHLHRAILDRLGGWGWSVIERWVFEAPSHGKITSLKNSVYRDFPGLILGCCSPGVSYRGRIISGDKLGHFLHSGYEMWVFSKNVQIRTIRDRRGLFSKTFDFFALTTTASFQKLYAKVDAFRRHESPALTDLEWAIELALAQEDGWWGAVGTGVKSYGDIAANVEGFHFWSDLTEGANPYFVCENGRWSRHREFTWSDFVTSAWDEGVNCSGYGNPKNENIVRERGLCPVNPERCEEIRARYGADSRMISPVCRLPQ